MDTLPPHVDLARASSAFKRRLPLPPPGMTGTEARHRELLAKHGVTEPEAVAADWAKGEARRDPTRIIGLPPLTLSPAALASLELQLTERGAAVCPDCERSDWHLSGAPAGAPGEWLMHRRCGRLCCQSVAVICQWDGGDLLTVLWCAARSFRYDPDDLEPEDVRILVQRAARVHDFAPRWVIAYVLWREEDEPEPGWDQFVPQAEVLLAGAADPVEALADWLGAYIDRPRPDRANRVWNVLDALDSDLEAAAGLSCWHLGPPWEITHDAPRLV